VGEWACVQMAIASMTQLATLGTIGMTLTGEQVRSNQPPSPHTNIAQNCSSNRSCGRVNHPALHGVECFLAYAPTASPYSRSFHIMAAAPLHRWTAE